MSVELLSGSLAALIILSLLALMLLNKNRSAGVSNPTQIQSLLSSAQLAKTRGDVENARMLYESAVSQLESSYKPDESLLCTSLEHLAELYERNGDWNRARELRGRMLSIFESALSKERVDFFTDIDYLCTHADFGVSTRDVATFYEKLLAYREKKLPPRSTEFINTIVIYAKLMRALGEKQVADDLEQHAEKLRKGGSPKLELGGIAGSDSSGGNASSVEDLSGGDKEGSLDGNADDADL